MVCHRIVDIKIFNEKEWGFMTKGDDNKHDDRWLLKSGSNWIKPDQIRGLVWFKIPTIGLPVLWIKESIYGKVNQLFGGGMKETKRDGKQCDQIWRNFTT